jgi:hypothetical protein
VGRLEESLGFDADRFRLKKAAIRGGRQQGVVRRTHGEHGGQPRGEIVRIQAVIPLLAADPHSRSVQVTRMRTSVGCPTSGAILDSHVTRPLGQTKAFTV